MFNLPRISLPLLFIFSGILQNTYSQNKGAIPLSTGKFITGDDAAWSSPGFQDAEWKDQRLGEVWQRQGFPSYHGYAWYRIHITIPASLKNNAGWKDSLRIFLAHVNDVDETFLNGVKIGKTGTFPNDPGGYISMWPMAREYRIAANNPAIKWDGENVIAVRVYDGGGSGGIFMGKPYVDMLEKIDGVSFDEPVESLHYLAGGKAVKSLRIHNQNHTPVDGTLSYTIYDAQTGRSLRSSSAAMQLPASGYKDLTLEMPHKMGIEVSAVFLEKRSGEKKSYKQVLPYLLTPAAGDKPQINGAKVFGVRPGSPFFFKIPATGRKPLAYSVKDLPSGLSLDAAKGVISGVLPQAGIYHMVFAVKNAAGSAERPFTIKAGDLLALTPPMGWNSWNCWGLSVSDEKVKSSARALIDKGLIDHGWMYMNIDDGWESPERAADGKVVPNEKFPDMKGLGDYLHGNGLRFGIYSSPGPKTCGGFLGSYQHEGQDADSYASWGIDYLKYDLCSYTEFLSKANTTEENQKPYILMRDLLKRQPRDIVYSLCQYGWRDVWKWGPEMNGNLWRTTGDIEDTWTSLYRIGFSQAKLSDFAQPGHWNDPDMLIVGKVGWGENLHPTRLTPYEQYTHMSLWSMLSAPLLLGCDLSKLDPFTLNLLTNDEVIAIDQDPLGKQAHQVINKDSMQVWVKDLEDGGKAVGVFNLKNEFQTLSVKWEDIGLKGNISVRDVWKQKGLGVITDTYTVVVPPHGVQLVKVQGFKETVISEPPATLGLDTFYKKYINAGGIPIVSSAKVPDSAMFTARDIVNYMLLIRPDVREAMINRKARLLVMAQSEMETDLPERHDWKKPAKDDRRLTPGERENYDKPGGIASMSDREYWNKRARGMGGNITSCAEENLLGYPGTRYYGENILVHEFSHNIMGALRTSDTALYREIGIAYDSAKARGMYKGQYAINTVAEYWAEGTQWWFWSNIEYYDGDRRVQSPDDLKAYDPALYHILERVYASHHVPADVYYGRNLRPMRKRS